MKREADALRRNVRELARELAEEEETMPVNTFAVTNHKDRVVSLRLYIAPALAPTPLNMTAEDAVELAAWIVIAAGLGESMTIAQARTAFECAYADALNS